MTALVRPVRTAWRRLTAMRTAVILLFLLAVAAVPGSLLPQRPLNPTKTAEYIQEHGAWGRFLDSIGMYDVFGSVWLSCAAHPGTCSGAAPQAAAGAAQPRPAARVRPVRDGRAAR